ncbi:MAG: hypothetical protein JWR84_1130 [Caulobacter sp.]|nr:hypothetical protein [Caulobacter sp.]
MTQSPRLTVLALAFLTLAPAGAWAQSDVKDRAQALNATIGRESEAGFAEFRTAGESGGSVDVVCPHLAAGVRHFIAANQTANNLIDLLQGARLWDSVDAAHAVGVKMASTANGAIDLYNKNCKDWVDPTNVR